MVAAAVALEPIERLPLTVRKFLEYERYYAIRPDRYHAAVVNGHDLDPGLNSKYLPQNCPAFRLPIFSVQRSFMNVYRSAGRSRSNTVPLAPSESAADHVLFPIHPNALTHYQQFISRAGAQRIDEPGAGYWAVPTTSVRTLLAWPDGQPENAFFAKTSLPFTINGIHRGVLDSAAARGPGLTTLLDGAWAELPPSLGYFPEIIGLVPRNQVNSAAILRALPSTLLSGENTLAPMLALWGADVHHTALLLTMLRQTELDPLAFIEKHIAIPVAQIWSRLVVDCGLMFELHGQNLLIELLPRGEPSGRFFIRDFETLQVDWDFRRWRGLFVPQELPRAHAWEQTYSGRPIGSNLARSLHSVCRCFFSIDGMLQVWHSLRLLKTPAVRRGDVMRLFVTRLYQQVTGDPTFVPDREDPHVWGDLPAIIIRKRLSAYG